ncbi:MAG: DUF3780 domain-containing protein [Verrucomicrobia bacterium]|nr:DUF3780 domain-containing protein [Verrucomicrobiota bacterium]
MIKPAAKLKPQSLGFGFQPTESEHHFLVTLPSGSKEMITISEHFEWRNTSNPEAPDQQESVSLNREDSGLRVILGRDKWNRIADVVRTEFNQRLKVRGQKPGHWKGRAVPLNRLLGKELLLLCWAIEDADPNTIPTATTNWLGLAPEERWWLFTMTNAATGHALQGRNKGWRKAVRFALTENPVSERKAASEHELFRLIAEDVRHSVTRDMPPTKPVTHEKSKRNNRR